MKSMVAKNIYLFQILSNFVETPLQGDGENGVWVGDTFPHDGHDISQVLAVAVKYVGTAHLDIIKLI